MTPLAAFALAGCLAVGAGSDHVTARDLVPAFPGVDASAFSTPMALAPAPGAQRVWRGAELLQLASRLHVPSPDLRELCVERPVAVLEPAPLLEAMRRSLPNAAIDILDFSRTPAPQGEMEFPIAGLHKTPSSALWTGSIHYAANRRFAIWAKVSVRTSASRVIAAAALPAGRPVSAADLRVESREDFPDAEFLTTIEVAAGRVLRRPVPAGTPLRAQWLDPPSDVSRCEVVHVDVWSGGAHLELDAESQASAAIGQTVPLINPISKKRFLARVEAKGRAIVGTEPK